MDAFYPPLFNTQTFCLTLNGRSEIYVFGRVHYILVGAYSEESIAFSKRHIPIFPSV